MTTQYEATDEDVANMRKVLPSVVAKIEATERRLTVERIRERVEALDNYDHQHDHVVLRWIDVRAILDDISKEGTP